MQCAPAHLTEAVRMLRAACVSLTASAPRLAATARICRLRFTARPGPLAAAVWCSINNIGAQARAVRLCFTAACAAISAAGHIAICKRVQCCIQRGFPCAATAAVLLLLLLRHSVCTTPGSGLLCVCSVCLLFELKRTRICSTGPIGAHRLLTGVHNPAADWPQSYDLQSHQTACLLACKHVTRRCRAKTARYAQQCCPSFINLRLQRCARNVSAPAAYCGGFDQWPGTVADCKCARACHSHGHAVSGRA